MYIFSTKKLVSKQNMLIIRILKHLKPAAWKLSDQLQLLTILEFEVFVTMMHKTKQ